MKKNNQRLTKTKNPTFLILLHSVHHSLLLFLPLLDHLYLDLAHIINSLTDDNCILPITHQ